MSSTQKAYEILSGLSQVREAEHEAVRSMAEQLGFSVLEQLADHKLLSEWLLCEFGSVGHIPDEIGITLRVNGCNEECPNCGSDGSYRECGGCGGESYILSPDISECRTCGVRETYPAPPISTHVDNNDPLSLVS